MLMNKEHYCLNEKKNVGDTVEWAQTESIADMRAAPHFHLCSRDNWQIMLKNSAGLCNHLTTKAPFTLVYSTWMTCLGEQWRHSRAASGLANQLTKSNQCHINSH